MPIAEFPLPSVLSTNPQPAKTYQLPEKFQVASTKFADGGMETLLQAGGNGIKQWVLTYHGLSQAEAAILDSHAYAAKLSEEDGPSAHTFNFRDPKTGTLYSGVHYLRYERPEHNKDWIQSRNVVLVKYP